MTLDLSPILPLWLIGAIAAALLLVLGYGCLLLRRKRLPGRWIALLGVLRVLVVAALVATLLRPTVGVASLQPSRESALLLIDRSESMRGKSHEQLEAVADRIAEQFDVQRFAFGQTALPMDGGVDEPMDRLDVTSTDIATSLQAAAQTHRLTRAAPGTAIDSLTRVVLFSDGLDHGQRDAVLAAQRNGLIVDVLPPTLVNDRVTETPASIVSLQAPQRVQLGAQLRITATLLAPASAEEQTLTVDLLRDGEVRNSAAVTFAPGQTVAPITLYDQPARPGAQAYRVAIRRGGVDESDDEQRAASAGPEVVVQAVSRQLEVLLIEGGWRWSFKFTRRVIEDDPNLNLTSFIARNDRAWMQFAEPGQRPALAGLPRNLTDLARYDLFVLGDVAPSRLPTAMLDGIRHLVAEEGRSLVVVAGPSTSQLAAAPGWSSLLPVETQPTRSVGPIRPRVSDDASNDPAFFRPGSEGDQLWQALPDLEHIYPPRRKKPAATVLLEASRQRNDFGPLIVAASHPVGRGKVLYIATDQLWQWQMLGPMTGNGLTPYAVFWQQALRSMSPQRPGGQRDTPPIIITPQRTVVRVGHPLELVIDLDGADADAGLNASAQFANEATRPLILTPDPLTPGRFRAELYAPAAGLSTIRVSGETKSGQAIEAQAAVDVLPAASEASDVGIDAAFLNRLANETGGRVIDPDDDGTWPQASAEPREVEHARVFDLWSNFALPLLLVVLLGIDWTLRLVRGYA